MRSSAPLAELVARIVLFLGFLTSVTLCAPSNFVSDAAAQLAHESPAAHESPGSQSAGRAARGREDELAPVELGDEYHDYAKTSPRGSSRRRQSGSFAEAALLYLPNRVLDLLDIFRVDVGVGPAYGGVLRMTQHGELGARYLRPGSLRVGLFGRHSPVRWEEGEEYGFGPWYVKSREREVGDFEVGASVDLFAGASVGLRLDEAVDFLLGIFGIDIEDDDLR